MHSLKSRFVVLAATIFVAAATWASPPATAQVAGATISVKWLARDGGDVNCSPPSSTGVALGSCSVSASASGTTVDNLCREEVAVSAPPVGNSVFRDGCSVSLTGSITAAMETVGDAGENVVYTCAGAGLGTLRYTPAPGSAGVGMSGPVVLTYEDGVLTAHGALINLSTVTVGEGNAIIEDPCGPDPVVLPHLFTGEINL
jgi:hypothetical protein